MEQIPCQNGFLAANSSDLLWSPYIMMCSIEHECVVLVVSCKLQYGGNPYCEYLSTPWLAVRERGPSSWLAVRERGASPWLAVREREPSAYLAM